MEFVKKKFIRTFALIVVVAAVMALGGAVFAAPPGPGGGPDPDGEGTGPVGNVASDGSPETGPGDGSNTINTDALGMDAKAYAADYGVTVEEARRRLTLQGSVGSLEEALVDNESDTFGGLWIQHEPEFRIVARFTQGGESTVRPYVTDEALSGLVDVQTADSTLDDLEAAQDKAMMTVDEFGIPAESEIDVIGNRVKLFVVNRTGLDSSLAKPDVELPDEVDIVTVNELSTVTADLHAGLTTVPCTAGFSVVHSDGRKGITTAAHCGTAISFNGTALNYVQGFLGGNHDVQWHEAPGSTIRGLMRVQFHPKISRHVRSTRNRDAQVVGEYVCRYGKVTHFACGDIRSKHVQPTNQVGCENTPCQFSATFIRVRVTRGLVSQRGDSGGPWFSGNTAYGIHRSRSRVEGTNIMGDVYMAINYVSALGVSVITE